MPMLGGGKIGIALNPKVIIFNDKAGVDKFEVKDVDRMPLFGIFSNKKIKTRVDIERY